jgi:hypothetical protein
MEEKIITGISVREQMKKAQQILKTVVIPREKEYQRRINL